MTADRILAAAALVAFLLFIGVVAFSVRRLDLFAAILIGVGLVVYDLWTQLGPRRR